MAKPTQSNRPGNPAMVKGAPSLNPLGRAIAKKAPPGSDGVIAYGGFIPSLERSSQLTGTQKWTTYQNAINEGIVALGIRYASNLLAGAEWHAEVNPSGDKNADRGVEIVTKGLLQADMPKPWNFVVPKAGMFDALGFSLHATSMRRDASGMIVYAEIAHRPQYTVYRWDKPEETSALQGFWQLSRQGVEYYIPLEECLYCVDDTLTDSPEGTGLLRHVIELVRRLQRYQQLEAIAYEFDIGGLPIGYAPLADIIAPLGSEAKDADKQAAVDAATETLRKVLSERAKTPEKQPYLTLDSSTYTNPQDGSISSIKKWAVDVLRADWSGAPNLAAVVGRIQLEIARVFGVEFAMVGGGDSAGSYGMHEDKTSMFATRLETIGARLGSFATNQLCRRLIRANGLDPDTCTPRLVMEPISTDAIETVTRALANMALAGLAVGDPARNVLRKRMRLPPEPEPDPTALALPRRPMPQPGGQTTEPGANDPGAADKPEAPTIEGASAKRKATRKRKAAA